MATLPEYTEFGWEDEPNLLGVLQGTATPTSSTPLNAEYLEAAHRALFNQLRSLPVSPGPVPPVVDAPDPIVFTTGPQILLDDAAPLTSTGFETDPSWTNQGTQTGITLATDKAHAGTHALKIASTTGVYAYRYKTFTAVAGTRYELRFWAWLASGSNGTGGHVLGGFRDSALTSYIQVWADENGDVAINSNGGAYGLGAFPRAQWVEVHLAVTSNVGPDRVELSLNGTSWFDQTADFVGATMDRIVFGTDYIAPASNLWIDDVSLLDQATGGTTNAGTTQPSATPLHLNAFAADNAEIYEVYYKTSVGNPPVIATVAGPLTSSPYPYTPASTDEGKSLFPFVIASAAGLDSVSATGPSLLITGTGTPPDPTVPTPPSGSFPDVLAYDMSGSSEAQPSFNFGGGPGSWDAHPVSRNFPGPSDFAAATLWGALDNVLGVPQSKVVDLASHELWFRTYSTNGLWQRFQYNTGYIDGAYYQNVGGYSTVAAGQSVDTTNGGTQVNTPPDGGHYFHFYPNMARASITVSDIQAAIVIIRARLKPGYTGGSIVLCAAFDWWRSVSAPFNPDFSNNLDGSIGKWKTVGTSMRMYTMSVGDLSTLPSIPYSTAEMF